MPQRDSFLHRVALAARPGSPLLRVTASPWWARVLIAAGAQRATPSNAATSSGAAATDPPWLTAGGSRNRLAQAVIVARERVRTLANYYRAPSDDSTNVTSQFVESTHEILLWVQALALRLRDDARPEELAYLAELRSATSLLLSQVQEIGESIVSGTHHREESLFDRRHPAEGVEVAFLEDLPLNLSGVDLRNVPFDVEDLDDATWTDSTIWPSSSIAVQIASMSDEVAPGVYQVRSGTDRGGILILS